MNQEKDACNTTSASSTGAVNETTGGLLATATTSTETPEAKPAQRGALLPTPVQRMTPHMARQIQTSGSVQASQTQGRNQPQKTQSDQTLKSQSNQKQNIQSKQTQSCETGTFCAS